MTARSYPLIKSVIPYSYADRGGVAAGDRIVSINGNPVCDLIDLAFFQADERIRLKFIDKSGKNKEARFVKGFDEPAGIELEPIKVKRCSNKCIFCFVHQLPQGLRKSLYIKDEDYRLSFMYGNYVTFSDVTDAGIERIIRQRLSPVYISVHTTDNSLRRRMLGNRHARDILSVIKLLAEGRIVMHTQVVLCPGINDGISLKKTIQDMASFYPYVESLAIVPVGLTKFRKNKDAVIKVTSDYAGKLIQSITPYQKGFKKRIGASLIYLADEFYIISGTKIPQIKEYDNLPQLENGVGMIASFLKDKNKAINMAKKIKQSDRRMEIVTITGKLAAPWIKEFCRELEAVLNVRLKVKAVRNDFFGREVTVTGLLTGGDIIAQAGRGFKYLLIPSVLLKEGEGIFLDSINIDEISDRLGCRVITFEPSPVKFVEKIKDILEKCIDIRH